MLTNNMDESFPRAEQPTSFINRMRKDQLTSLYAMKYLEHYKTTEFITSDNICLIYTTPSPRDAY